MEFLFWMAILIPGVFLTAYCVFYGVGGWLCKVRSEPIQKNEIRRFALRGAFLITLLMFWSGLFNYWKIGIK
jgi:hypothetical protein